MYITVSDLIARFGVEEIAQISDRTIPRELTPEILELAVASDSRTGWPARQVEAMTAALARIDAAIGDAQSAVDGYLAGRYTTPLGTVPQIIRRLVCDIARFYLHGDLASDPIVKANEVAMALCRDISAGKITLPGELSASPGSSSSVAVVCGNRRWTREQRGLE